MIFITVGTQKFQFDRLIQAMDEIVGANKITEDVFAQIGNCEYIPRNFSYKRFLDAEEYEKCMKQCNIVIAHSGVATIIKGIQEEKNIIVVPRLKRFGEHVDDHQRQIADAFEDLDFIMQCLDVNQLAEMISKAKNHTFAKYKSQRDSVINTIDMYISTING